MLPKNLPLLFALAFVGAFGLASAARFTAGSKPTLESGNHDFDFFLFVRQWPGKTCSKSSCPSLHDLGYHFTIHGLWPNNNNGTWPQSCDTSLPFDEAQVTDLLEPLRAEWPTLMPDKDEDFWEHEWSKHGTCALDVLPSEHTYFARVLQLHWRFDLAAALRRANILPNEKRFYRKELLIEAVSDMYGVRPIVRCVGHELSEIWMCFDKQLRPIACDPSVDSGSEPCNVLIIPPLPNGAPPDLHQKALAPAVDGGDGDGSDSGGDDGIGVRLHSTRWRLRGLAQFTSTLAADVVHPEIISHSAARGDRETVAAVLTALSSMGTDRAAAAARHLSAQVLTESADSIGSAAGGHWQRYQWGNAAAGASAATLTSRSAASSLSGAGAWKKEQQKRPGSTTTRSLSGLMAAIGEWLRWPFMAQPATASGDAGSEEVPNGGASAVGWADARRDYVWRSKLREPEFGEGSSGQLATLAMVTEAAEGNGATMAVSPATDPWVAGLRKGGSVALHSGGGNKDPAWMVAMAISQQVCVAVIAVSLAVLAGVALTGAIRASQRRQRRRQRQGGGDRALASGRQLSGGDYGSGNGDLVVLYPLKEPLLPGSLEPSSTGRWKRREVVSTGTEEQCGGVEQCGGATHRHGLPCEGDVAAAAVLPH